MSAYSQPFSFKLSVLVRCLSVVLLMGSSTVYAEVAADEMDINGISKEFQVTLPTIIIESTSDQKQTLGYNKYHQASITRGEMAVKDVPQTIETINVQKNKLYGTNDLSSIVEGNAGIDATYDMRGESINIRGFSADASDIYLDGIRSSGQVRRSTANVERVEVLKGPASVLFGRSRGGGVINLVSKKANFAQRNSVNVRGGSWDRMGISLDRNQVLNPNTAVRLTTDYEQGDSFRSGIEYKNKMVSPSIIWHSDDKKLRWEGQYTYDEAWRVPDRGPEKSVYDTLKLGYDKGFAHDGDEVTDKLHFLRSSLAYDISPNWTAEWTAGYRKANQDFDHYYGGTLTPDNRLRQSYAWQQTENKTLSSSVMLKGTATTGKIDHQISLGYDFSQEQRNPLLFARSGAVTIDPYLPNTWIKNTHRLSPASIDNHHKGTTHSLFAQNLVSLTPDFKVMLGGRWDNYSFESENITRQKQKVDDTAFSPNVGLVWNVTPEHTLYTSYAKSYSPYGGNGYLGVTIGDQRKVNQAPEHNKQYEIGLKSDWLNGKLSTTASLYQLSHYDIRYRPDPKNRPFDFAIRGEEQSQGIDLSAVGKLSEKWYLRGSLGVMSAKVKEDKSNPIFEGKHLNGTSDIQGNLFVRYVPNPTWYGEMGVTHSDERYNYNTRTGVDSNIEGFTRVDAMFGYQVNTQLSTTLAVNNLFNTEYWRSGSMPGSPRSFMARLNYEF